MSKFFYTENLTTDLFKSDILPWDFKPTEQITAQIRGDKEERQNWYRNTQTRHYFYTGLEPLNPNLRPSKESNPPVFIHAFVADYDNLKLPQEKLFEYLHDMPLLPNRVEKSLGSNWRLVWELEHPIRTDSYDFCVFILQKAAQWLKLEKVPGLDAPSFENPTRLLCNGCDWQCLNTKPVPLTETQPFLIKCGLEFRFKGGESETIPLATVEPALKEKYPAFNWPQDFLEDSQGPTFWIPESTSPLSAIVKSGGMITFSAHAEKTFYTWADLLGEGFVTGFTQQALTSATSGVYWDGKRFHRKFGDHYQSMDRQEAQIFLEVDCKLSNKVNEKTGVSPIKSAISHIYNHNRIVGAAPFVFRRPGVLDYQGERVLNTYMGKPVEPASGKQEWGPHGNFPFISMWYEKFFTPVSPQLEHYLAWFKWFYTSAFTWTPMPGQNSFFLGGADVGKTLNSRKMIGAAVGGFVDASDYLIEGAQFNSHIMKCAYWCMDDDSASTYIAQQRVSSALKKMAGNQQFQHSKKFEQSAMLDWMGRCGITANLDFVSAKIVGSLDNTSLDKTNLFRCASHSGIKFPSRYELEKIISTELPFFLRYLLDWEPPDFVERHIRYGYASYQENGLLDQTVQASPVAPFKELLIDSLGTWFQGNPEADEFIGTSVQITRMMSENVLNEHALKGIRLDQISRFLEQLQKEGLLQCTTETGNFKTRVWRFTRDVNVFPKPTPPPAPEIPPVVEKFE